ncbi:FAD-binding protein [bacterium]|nr:FAD-binding protein [bacterium]
MLKATSSQLSALTSFKIGGRARELVTLTSIADLQVAAGELAGRTPVIIGGGTNVLLPDDNLELVWHLAPTDPSFSLVDEQTIEVWAGNATAKTAWELIRAGWAGLEKFTTLPGSLGGAIWGNAHAGDELVSDHVIEVTIFDLAAQQLATYQRFGLEFGYDQSRCQHEPWVIVSARLRVTPGQPEALAAVATSLMARKRQTQSFALASAGCFWQNPPNSEALRAQFPQFARRERFPAGFLIESLGLTFPAGARVTTGKHCSYLVNHGGASSREVRSLARQIQQQVQEKYGVVLVPEVAIYDQQGRRQVQLD